MGRGGEGVEGSKVCISLEPFITQNLQNIWAVGEGGFLSNVDRIFGPLSPYLNLINQRNSQKYRSVTFRVPGNSISLFFFKPNRIMYLFFFKLTVPCIVIQC